MEGMKKKRPPAYDKYKARRRELQATFVLAHPCHYIDRSIGELVTEFEKLNLNITAMNCMDVSEAFIREHLKNIGADLQAGMHTPYQNWAEYLSSEAVVAMVVKGEGAIYKIRKAIMSEKKLPFWLDESETVYTSKTFAQAQEDIRLWFGSVDFEEVVKKNRITFMLPNGEVRGPTTDVKRILKLIDTRELEPDLKDNFLMEYMCFMLIKPLAFQNRCIGEILSAIEANCLGLRGLKLVKKADHPSDAWLTGSDSLNKTDGDDYGVALVVFNIGSRFRITSEDPNRKNIDHENQVFEIGSNYLYKSESDQQLLEVAVKFFKYGYSAWAYPDDCMLNGCLFQASLVGLLSLGSARETPDFGVWL